MGIYLSSTTNLSTHANANAMHTFISHNQLIHRSALNPKTTPRTLIAMTAKRLIGIGIRLFLIDIDEELAEGFESSDAESAPIYCFPKSVIFPFESIIALSYTQSKVKVKVKIKIQMRNAQCTPVRSQDQNPRRYENRARVDWALRFENAPYRPLVSPA